MTFFDQFLDHFDLLWNVLYCTRFEHGELDNSEARNLREIYPATAP
jgi:hypothetical protein